jgi:DNA (cytosine-5)-methyltransferase 1
MKKANFTFIDLFAGIGGFHLGLEKIGGQCLYANEWDKYASLTYKSWYPNTPVDSRDIRKVDIAKDIPKHDVLAGGFPCQPFSLAGVSKKNSMGLKHGFDDTKQGNLFLQICKIVKIHQPKIVFLENVKNLVSHNRGLTWKTIQKKLDYLGYEVQWKIIDAKSWVPQHRERIYIVAFKRNAFTRKEIQSFRFPEKQGRSPALSEVLDLNPLKKYMLSDRLWNFLVTYAKKHKNLGNGFGFTIARPAGQSRTLSARYYKDGSEILIKQKGWKNPRRISPGEAARLMGFDDTWGKNFGNGFPQVVSDTQAYKQFGNSVCPHVVRAVGAEIANVLKARRSRISDKGL